MRSSRLRYWCALSFLAALGGVTLWIAGGATVNPPHPYGLDHRPVAKAYLNMPDRKPASEWSVSNAFPALSFQDPLMLLPVPNSTQLCVIGREGTVEFFQND